MSDLYEVLRSYLTGEASLTALVTSIPASDPPDFDIRPDDLRAGQQAGQIRSIVFREIGGDSQGTHDAPSIGWNGGAVIQTECWHPTSLGARQMGAALAEALYALSGQTVLGMRFGHVKRAGAFMGRQSELKSKVRIQDFEIPHSE